MWHQESSCTGVDEHDLGRPGSGPAGPRGHQGGRAPAARAASSASVVARVPPSCETRDAHAAALRVLGRVERLARHDRGGHRRRAPPRAAPRSPSRRARTSRSPTTVTGRPASCASRTVPASAVTPSGGESSSARTSAGCAATISSVTHGGPARNSGNSSVCQSSRSEAVEARADRVGDLLRGAPARRSAGAKRRATRAAAAPARPASRAPWASLRDGARVLLQHVRGELDGGRAGPSRRAPRRPPDGRRAAPARRRAGARARARAGSGPRARRCPAWPGRRRSSTDGRRRWRRGGASGRPGLEERRGDLAGHDHAAERQVAGRDALGERDQVRPHVLPALDPEPGAEPAEAADHAVDDQQDAVLGAQVGDALDVARRAAGGRRRRRSPARRRTRPRGRARRAGSRPRAPAASRTARSRRPPISGPQLVTLASMPPMLVPKPCVP